MPVERFLRQLFDHGRVTVEQDLRLQFDEQRLSALLGELDVAYRRQLPEGVPPLSPSAAMFGALVLYRGAQVLTYRDVGIEGLQQAIEAGPSAEDAGEQTSVDLCLHFLPDLVRLLRAASANDPLVACLLDLGASWPLSSIGIGGVVLHDQGLARVQALAKEPAAWRLYVDRVLQTSDVSRLTDPATRVAVRTAVGAYPQLAGKLLKDIEHLEREPAKEIPAA